MELVVSVLPQGFPSIEFGLPELRLLEFKQSWLNTYETLTMSWIWAVQNASH